MSFTVACMHLQLFRSHCVEEQGMIHQCMKCWILPTSLAVYYDWYLKNAAKTAYLHFFKTIFLHDKLCSLTTLCWQTDVALR